MIGKNNLIFLDSGGGGAKKRCHTIVNSMKHSIITSIGLAVLASVAFSSLAEGVSTMTYTATGGLISGTIGGTPFINATWSITADGDAAAVQSALLVLPSATLPYYYVPVAPVLTIDDGISTPWVANLLDSGPWTWNAISIDYSSLLPLFSGNGFIELAAGTPGPGAAVMGQLGYNNLASVLSFSGDSNFGDTYPTSLGDLEITDQADGPGTFIITAVPETSTTVPTLALIAGGLMLRRRTKHLR